MKNKIYILFSFYLLFALDSNNKVDVDNSTYCTNCYQPIANAGIDK